MPSYGMRTDGRLPDQLRPVKITTGYLITAEGSSLIECGNTRVLCTASVEDTTPAFLRGTGKGLDYGRVRHGLAALHVTERLATGNREGPDRPAEHDEISV